MSTEELIRQPWDEIEALRKQNASLLEQNAGLVQQNAELQDLVGGLREQNSQLRQELAAPPTRIGGDYSVRAGEETVAEFHQAEQAEA